ncbi:hypothetical protein [Sinobaca sp. H24]|uniref:hypothetical protein n=1 Tax=Sinobaca sp. H24 TaxID=2923376 RepID=UPI00207A3B9F|nr:hypothetical protein [Sinobaca sp. H24]
MAYILIDDMQIPAVKYEEKEAAKEAAAEKEVVVEDNNNKFWVIDEESYAKIEGFGYTIV